MGVFGLLVAACSTPSADCTSAIDCEADEICVGGGGILFGGGRCVTRHHFGDARPTDGGPADGDAVDADGRETSDGDTEGVSDTDVDTAVACTDGESRPCYDGPPGTAGVGVCERGTQRCDDGRWQSCTDQTTPIAYDKCGNRRDDDCDGAVDDRADAGNACEASCHCLSGRCLDGTCAHRVFVTSDFFVADFGGVSNADSHCRSAADDAGLDGEWKAIISSRTQDARSRLEISAAIYNLDGARVADGADDLWDGTVAEPIEFDEHGKARDYHVWTGSTSDGLAASHCENWSRKSESSDGIMGHNQRTDEAWIDEKPRPCWDELALYCIDGQ